MRNIERAIFTNMVMIRRGGQVLVIERTGESWPGIAFPGGHVEDGESFTDAAKREIREETGLEIDALTLCGVKNWIREDGVRYVVFLYVCDCPEGTEAVSSEEGRVFWVSLDELTKLPLCSTMEITLRVYLDAGLSEHCMRRREQGWDSRLL